VPQMPYIYSSHLSLDQQQRHVHFSDSVYSKSQSDDKSTAHTKACHLHLLRFVPSHFEYMLDKHYRFSVQCDHLNNLNWYTSSCFSQTLAVRLHLSQRFGNSLLSLYHGSTSRNL